MRQPPRRRGNRAARSLAGLLVLGVGVGAGTLFGAGPAAAAAPHAQAVGRFLDGAAGGTPIEAIADLKDARARYPGGASDQNPLDVTLGGQATIPLSHQLQQPGQNVFHIGVANQIAKARADGYALGAAGAVANQGGASLGGQSGTYPSDATLTLSPAALPSAPIPLPGGNAAALGGITLSVGAVSAKAYTPAGFAKDDGVTHYNIAGLDLTLASPALGGVLEQVGNALQAPALPGLPAGIALPSECSFKTQVMSTITLDGGAVTIDPTGGSIQINVAALLRQAGMNINYLPANTDLLAKVLDYLASPDGLAKGLQNVLSGLTNPLAAQFTRCLQSNQLTDPVMTALLAGQSQLQGAINQIVDRLTAAGGSNPLAPLANGLKQALDIGVNVQPNGPRGSYSSPLRATPDQATAVVPGQTIVRALEIDLGGGQGASLALANAAAGPSTAPAAAPPAPKPHSAHVVHNHVIPTGVPAGKGPIGSAPHGPELPIVLAGTGIVLAAAGAFVWRWGARAH